MFKADIQVRNGTLDVSKTILHDKMLQCRFLIYITLNNHNLPDSLKGGGGVHGKNNNMTE